MGQQTNFADRDTKRSVRVWDCPVRIFHWLLAALIVASWVTSEIGDHAMTYHKWSGYTILSLVLFRVIWGFLGSQHARFRDFIYGPRAAFAYAREMVGLQSPYYLGHNPLGGWSVILMLASILLQAVTGLFANDEIATEGPLAPLVSSSTSALLTAIHRYNFYVLAALVSVHIAAALFYLIVKRENLIAAMFTGNKLAPAQSDVTDGRMASPWLALIIMGVVAGAVAVVVNWR